MILHYFTKKENTESIIATNIYKSILKRSNNFLRQNNFFINKDYNTSFEIVSFILIIYINLNIKNYSKYKKINDNLISIFISDLDESLRSKGIGDMSIGKYVKSYVKKFYFRLSKFPRNTDFNSNEIFHDYLKLIKMIKNDEYLKASKKFLNLYKEILNTHMSSLRN